MPEAIAEKVLKFTVKTLVLLLYEQLWPVSVAVEIVTLQIGGVISSTLLVKLILRAALAVRGCEVKTE